MMTLKHEKLTSHLFQPAVVVSDSMQVLDINKEALSYFHVTSEEALNFDVSNLISNNSIRLVIEAFKQNNASSDFTLANNLGITSSWMIIPVGLAATKSYLLICKDNLASAIKARDNTLQIIEELAELMPGNFYWKDVRGIYLGCNSSLIRTLGLASKDGIVGKTDYDLWPQHADELRRNDLFVMETGNPLAREETALMADGSTGYFAAIKVPMKASNGKVIGIIGNSLDITAEKLKLEMELEQQKLEYAMREAQDKAAEARAEAQAQEETQKALLTFTGTMSHDLRTPLSTIKLITAQLAKNVPKLIQVYKQFDLDKDDNTYINPKQLKGMEDSYLSIGEAVKEADSYIDITLKMLKSTAAGIELLKKEDLVACSIDKILRRVISSYPFASNELNKVHFKTCNDFSFMGNAIFMARILQNLIKNSLEQIKLKGKGEVFISTESGHEANHLKLKDTAGEVSSSTLQHLFDSFHSSKKGGTGLGLSSAKKIMLAFGGDIDCHLVDGDCVEFTLIFPPISRFKQ